MASMKYLTRCISGYRSSVLRQGVWGVAGVRQMSDLMPQFEEAKAKLNTLKEDPGSDIKLKIYALFKQATQGQVNTKRPSMVDFVGRAKWDAWNALGSMTQQAAQQEYIDLVKSLADAEEPPTEGTEGGSAQKYSTLLVSCEGGLRTIKLNRPKKFNAITVDMYNEWSAALKEAAEDPNTVLTAITGAGDYYCSGNDLSNFTGIDPSNMAAHSKQSGELLYNFVSSFIEFPKPLIAVVNGPALGVSVTVMGLFDMVYASDKATFSTPFSRLGQSPEGCSSYTFPRLMGPAKANELLLFNKKITAQEACNLGLVTEVFPDATFQQEVWPRLKEYSKLPAKSLIYSKALTRDMDREILQKVNRMECDRLVERWVSEDCINAIMKFFSRKN